MSPLDRVNRDQYIFRFETVVVRGAMPVQAPSYGIRQAVLIDWKLRAKSHSCTGQYRLHEQPPREAITRGATGPPRLPHFLLLVT